METITIRGEAITADEILWRRFGTAGRDMIVEFFRLNPGLAAAGWTLPVGATVRMPEAPATPASARERRIVTLFG